MEARNSVTSLSDILEVAAVERPAVILPEVNKIVSYGELRTIVDSLATALQLAGARTGDRIATALPNGLAALVSVIAAGTVGIVAPLNPSYKLAEFKFYLEDIGASILLVSEDSPAQAVRAASELGISVMTVGKNGEVSSPHHGHHRSPPAANDIALVLHTSGSTGRPKRVPIRHSNIAASVRNIISTYQLGVDDVSLCVMPLFHVHGLIASALSTLGSSGCLVVPAKFKALSFNSDVRKYGVTWYSAVPTIHQLAISRKSDKSELRFVRSCSSALRPELMERIEEHFQVPVLEAYGMTEATHQIASNALPPGVRTPGAVGRATNVGVAVYGDSGARLPAGEKGEVCIMGPSVIDDYEGAAACNSASFWGKWFRTGDQGMLDSSGTLILTGRIKELINRGGEKISPLEIDGVILSHSKVVEAVSFGIPHEAWGEEVAAVVVTTEPVTETELLSWCRERLADFKCPKRIYLSETIPRTATGKIQRLSLASVFANRGK